MKTLFAILIFSIFLASCGKIENFTNLTQQKVESENPENEQPDAPPILEIIEDAKGMSAVTGKTLFFNLYDNGIIEFEYADEKKTAGNSNKAEEINTLKRAKISREELQKFIDLLKSEDFQNAKSDYRRKCSLSDMSKDYRISFSDGLKEKNINAGFTEGFKQKCRLSEQGNTDFPKVLNELLILADNLRTKYNSQ